MGGAISQSYFALAFLKETESEVYSVILSESSIYYNYRNQTKAYNILLIVLFNRWLLFGNVSITKFISWHDIHSQITDQIYFRNVYVPQRIYWKIYLQQSSLKDVKFSGGM